MQHKWSQLSQGRCYLVGTAVQLLAPHTLSWRHRPLVIHARARGCILSRSGFATSAMTSVATGNCDRSHLQAGASSGPLGAATALAAGRRSGCRGKWRAVLAPPCRVAEPGKDAGSFLKSSASGNGTFVLMLISCVLYLLDHVLHLPGMTALYLYNSHPQWWQLFSHQFCHGNLAHLSANMFQLCVFGRFVEDTEGFWGVIFIYLITGVGAALASIITMPGSVGVGASGAIFGLFATSVLLRVSNGLSVKNLLEAVVLGNFVVRQLMDEMRSQVTGGLSVQGMQVAHVAHLGGALAGVVLVLMLSRLPK